MANSDRKLAGNFIFLISPWIWGEHLPCLGSIDTFAAMAGKWCAASSAESEICFPAARGSQWITGSEMCFFIFSFLGHDRDKDASVSSVSGLDWNHTNRT